MVDRAVIWDMDGILVDTASWHFAAWRQFCERHGCHLTEVQFRATFGQRNQEIIRLLFGQETDESRLQVLADEKEELFRAAVIDEARPLPGVVPALTALRSAGYQQAIGSSAPRKNIDMLTTALGIEPFFMVIVSEEDVRHGKPAPEIFLRAAQRLGIEPAHCVVIEDAVAGVSAAKAAGMACLAVTNTRDRAALKAADLVVDSLEKVSVDTINKLLSVGEKGRPG